jgi:PPOX class probable F420-dependent enzyme
MTQDQLDEFLKRPLVAVLGTVDKAGRPRSSPIWYHWDNGAASMFTGRRTLKWRNLQALPHASLCIDKREPPYAWVVMNGPVQEADRPLYDLVLSMALRYYGEKKGRAFAERYRNPPPSVVVFMLAPRHIASVIDG